jgi:hypothetical protein
LTVGEEQSRTAVGTAIAIRLLLLGIVGMDWSATRY